jgi:hypothetical protein
MVRELRILLGPVPEPEFEQAMTNRAADATAAILAAMGHPASTTLVHESVRKPGHFLTFLRKRRVNKVNRSESSSDPSSSD